MLALVYLILTVMLGDAVCRRFCKYVSQTQRWATAFIVGLMLSTWSTYLIARAFASTSSPLRFGNLIFLSLAILSLFLIRRFGLSKRVETSTLFNDTRENKLDWLVTGIFFIAAWWLMFSSFNMESGKLQIANHQWSDFGPNVALMQSFALGNNFPTEYPHFAGDRIRYHFLFYFQAGNLEYLGFNPAWSNNILSVLSLVSMLVLVMALGTLLFNKRVIGRLGAGLFFFHGSLAYIPFLRSQSSTSAALSAVVGLASFLPSGFPYRGEDWGMWSLLNFINQRHFASAIAVLLIAFIFLVDRYKSAIDDRHGEIQDTDQLEYVAQSSESNWAQWFLNILPSSSSYIFIGCLTGLLPMWNGAVFIAAIAVIGSFLVFSGIRKETIALLLTAALVSLPQVLYLRGGNVREASYSLFHWGYTITDPTILNVLKYLIWTFGFKWLFIGIALIFLSGLQRRLFVAISSLVAVAFLFQFSEEVLANHKFLNIWLIVANLFVAYGIWWLWHIAARKGQWSIRTVTVILAVMMVTGGVIDLFPIHRAYWAEVPFEGDPLVRWTEEQTDPRSVFLSDRFVTHQILLAGRPVFFGWPYYGWGAGYRTDEREATYRQLFQERDPTRLRALLHDNNISYVAIDDGLRRGDFITNLNEAVYESNFERVFQDSEKRYGGLSIFKVPEESSPTPISAAVDASNLPAVNAFAGGRGMAHGQFASARGVAVDADGNIFVADTGNSRIQKFSPSGDFISTIGKSGTGLGQLKDPVGVAVDNTGNVYVTDSGTHQVLKFRSDGSYLAQWIGPPPGFYGPIDVAIGPQGYLYVVDQGRARVVVMDTSGNILKEWGKKGAHDGEFNDPTGIAVGSDRVYVSDLQNYRVQVFSLEGEFIKAWSVSEWKHQVFHNPDAAVDFKTNRVYVSSGATNQIITFDSNGRRLSTSAIKVEGLNRPSGLAVFEEKGMMRLCIMNTDGARLSAIDLDSQTSGKRGTLSASTRMSDSGNE